MLLFHTIKSGLCRDNIANANEAHLSTNSSTPATALVAKVIQDTVTYKNKRRNKPKPKPTSVPFGGTPDSSMTMHRPTFFEHPWLENWKRKLRAYGAISIHVKSEEESTHPSHWSPWIQRKPPLLRRQNYFRSLGWWFFLDRTYPWFVTHRQMKRMSQTFLR